MTVVKDNFLGPTLDDVGEGAELVVIDFSATWCGPCKRYDPVFNRLAHDVEEEKADEPVAFLSVDVDRNKRLAQSYGVKSVPTTVIAAREKGILWGHRWREKARFSGVIPYPRLMQAVEEQIEELEG